MKNISTTRIILKATFLSGGLAALSLILGSPFSVRHEASQGDVARVLESLTPSARAIDGCICKAEVCHDGYCQCINYICSF